MVGVVRKGRLFAALLVFVAGLLLADMAKALRAPLYEEVIVPPPMLSTLVMLFGYILGLVFSVRTVNAVVGRYRQNQPLQMRHFTIVMVSAACFMTMPFMIDVMECFLIGVSALLVTLRPALRWSDGGE